MSNDDLSAAEWRSYANGLMSAIERVTPLAQGALDAAGGAARPLELSEQLVELLEELDSLRLAALGLAERASRPGPKARRKALPARLNALYALVPPSQWPKSKGGRPSNKRAVSDCELLSAVVLGRAQGAQSDVEVIRTLVAKVWLARNGNRHLGSQNAEVQFLQRRLSELRKASRSKTAPNSANE